MNGSNSPSATPAAGSRLLLIIFLLAFTLRLGAALSLPSFVWPDEIFQTLEPAHHLAFGEGILTWEFREGARSWVWPAILAGVMRASEWMGAGSSGYLTGLAVFLCLLSLVPVWFAYAWSARVAGERAGLVAAVVSAVWFELIFFSAKALTEVVATSILLPGLYLAAGQDAPNPRRRLFWGGLLCGLALAFRIHLAPAVAFAVLYLCRNRWRERCLPMLAGVSLPLIFFGLVDAFTWSYPFQSFASNIWINLALGKTREFAVLPWYGYAKMFFDTWSYGAALVVFLAVVGARRSPLLAWLVVVILVSHSALAHKEYRYIYPAIPLLCTLAGLGLAEVTERLRSRRATVLATAVLLAAWLTVSAALALRFGTLWQLRSGNLRAFSELSREKTLCGVGLANVSWMESGGYTYLHRAVPIVPLNGAEDAAARAPQFNFLLTARDQPLWPQGFDALWCWQGACLLRRLGNCTPVPGYHINRVLEERGK